jgi:hypothetical protein
MNAAALRAEGLDPDDPAVIGAIDLVRWKLSLGIQVTGPRQHRAAHGNRGPIGGAYTTAPHWRHAQVICPPQHEQGWRPTSIPVGRVF